MRKEGMAMLFFLTLGLQLLDKALEGPAARKRLARKGRELGLKDDDNVVVLPGLDIVLPERDAKHFHPELIRRLANGRVLHEDMRQAGVLR